MPLACPTRHSRRYTSLAESLAPVVVAVVAVHVHRMQPRPPRPRTPTVVDLHRSSSGGGGVCDGDVDAACHFLCHSTGSCWR